MRWVCCYRDCVAAPSDRYGLAFCRSLSRRPSTACATALRESAPLRKRQSTGRSAVPEATKTGLLALKLCSCKGGYHAWFHHRSFARCRRRVGLSLLGQRAQHSAQGAGRRDQEELTCEQRNWRAAGILLQSFEHFARHFSRALPCMGQVSPQDAHAREP